MGSKIRQTITVFGAFIAALLSATASDAGEKPPIRPEVLITHDKATPLILDFSPDGKAAVWLDAGGLLRIYDRSGIEKLAGTYRGAEKAAVSNGAKRCIVAGVRRSRWWVRLIGPGRRLIWKQNLDGKVRAVTISPDGFKAFAAMSGGRMYVFDIRRSPKWRRIKVEKSFTHLAPCNLKETLSAQTESPRGFGLIGYDGKMLWWKPLPPGTYSTTLCAGGRLLVSAFSRISPTTVAGFSVYDLRGSNLLTRVKNGFEPRVAMSADGKYLAMSYRRKLVHRKEFVFERRVALFSTSGRKLWEQGGLFFKPVLAGMTSDPLGIILAEDYTLLSALDRNGKLAWRGPSLRSSLIRLIADDDWRLGWAVYKDGGIELWRLSPA